MSRKQRIEALISKEYNPNYLLVENESHKHHVPDDSETHFKIVLVSEQFQTLTKIARHRLINRLLAEELDQGLHALSLSLHTPDEWKNLSDAIPSSPACRDGYQR